MDIFYTYILLHITITIFLNIFHFVNFYSCMFAVPCLDVAIALMVESWYTSIAHLNFVFIPFPSPPSSLPPSLAPHPFCKKIHLPGSYYMSYSLICSLHNSRYFTSLIEEHYSNKRTQTIPPATRGIQRALSHWESLILGEPPLPQMILSLFS